MPSHCMHDCACACQCETKVEYVLETKEEREERMRKIKEELINDKINVLKRMKNEQEQLKRDIELKLKELESMGHKE